MEIFIVLAALMSVVIYGVTYGFAYAMSCISVVNGGDTVSEFLPYYHLFFLIIVIFIETAILIYKTSEK